MHGSRVLFRENVDYTTFEAFAEGQGWRLVADLPAGEDTPEQISWVTPDGTHVTIVWDELVGLAYVVVAGTNPAGTERRLRERFPGVDVADTLRSYEQASSTQDRVSALVTVALTAPTGFEPRVHDAVVSALQDDDSDVRAAGVLAVMYAPWEEFLAPLRRIAEGDPEPGLRETAGQVAGTIGAGPRQD